MKISVQTRALLWAFVMVSLSAGLHAEPDDQPFQQVNRPGSVDLETEYDLSDLRVDRQQIHTLLPRDAIPALTDPELVEIGEADYLNDDDRVIDVTIENESVAVPLKVLNFHEVANIKINGVPVAATYCPLCDSVTLVDRRVLVKPSDPLADAHEEVLEFGVSGALYNSNVLMYDRTHKGLWSQIGLEAISGPMAGTRLKLLPVAIVPFSKFREDHPGGSALSIETGYDRPYEGNPYEQYFQNQDYIMVPVHGFGDELPKKTLGLGIRAGEQAIFVPAEDIGERFVIKTEMGEVIAASTDAGVQVLIAPPDVQTLQSFYYSFSAFNPETKVLRTSQED